MTGTKYKVKNDCLCQHYLHEVTNYPRPGLIRKELKEGDIVTFIKSWNNFYGSYYTVEKDGETYDIRPRDLEKI